MKKLLIVLGFGIIIFLGLLNRQHKIMAEKNKSLAMEQVLLFHKCQEQFKMKIDSLNIMVKALRELADKSALEASVQKVIADNASMEAIKQKMPANANAAEAMRQALIAKENAKVAQRQRVLADSIANQRKVKK